MLIRKGQWPILIVNLAYLIPSAIFYSMSANYEFLAYIGVIILFFILVLATNARVNYPNSILWGLTLWGVMHMAGGSVPVGGDRLYGLMILPVSDTLPIIRYDQVVHTIGFGVATLLMYHLLRPSLKDDIQRWTGLSIVIVMAGLGVGGFNEIVEFVLVVALPETGVGGYDNTMLDMVADFIGALLAIVYIHIQRKRSRQSAPA